MEQTPIFITTNDKKQIDNPHGLPQKAKKRGALQLLRVVLLMLKRPSSKSKSVEMASRTTWRRLVDSMRHFHLQSNKTPPTSIQAVPINSPLSQHFMSPYESNSLSASSSTPSFEGLTSSYASANNLRELDGLEPIEDLDEEFVYDGDGGDDMIDQKAEEFIAMFYNQIKQQTMNSNDLD